MKSFLFTFFISTIFISCTNSELSLEEKELKSIIGEKLILNFDSIHTSSDIISLAQFKEFNKFYFCIYIDEKCSSCYPKILEWEKKIEEIGYNDQFTTLYIIRTSNYNDFYCNLQSFDSIGSTKERIYYRVLDPNVNYLTGNQNIPSWILENPILINSNNEILMVGPPFASQQMQEIFHNIILK